VSVRRVEDVTEALWRLKLSAGTVSDLNQKMYERIEAWRDEPIQGHYAYVYLEGIGLKRTWGDEVKNVAVRGGVAVVSRTETSQSLFHRPAVVLSESNAQFRRCRRMPATPLMA
jgi:hypothetical protein